MKEKIVLAYSGGLDTSVAVHWLIQKGYDVIACCLDVGEGKDLDHVRQKAYDVGAIDCHIINATAEFSQNYVSYAIKGNLMYENTYPLVSALSRPLIAQKLVDIAEQHGATAIAHGCTGKGNDQVRFEVAIKALNPSLNVIAPVREWSWSREEEIDYAKKHAIPITIGVASPYSIDQNLWGRANECGILEDPYATPPEDAYDVTTALEHTPDTPDIITLQFEQGLPVSINNNVMPLDTLILELNALAGKHGIGRIDHVENRLVGIKSREVYETPAATVIINAHRALESITLTKEVAHFKPIIEQRLSEAIYNGLWFSPLVDALKAFIDETQQDVSGELRIKLFKGHAIVEGRQSHNSLYNKALATYTKEDAFNQDSAVGFIDIYGLPTEVYAMKHGGDQHG